VPKEVASRSISEGVEALQARKRKADASPPVEEWKREFPGKVKVDERTGEFSLTLHDRADIRKAHEMQEGSRKHEVERGAELQSRMSKEKVVRRDGRVIDFPEEMIDQAKHRFRPAGRSGIAPAERFSMSDIAPDLERGPDGLYFRWNDGWEPVNLFRNGALSPQRDPDGNVWVEANGEWSLMDEVG